MGEIFIVVQVILIVIGLGVCYYSNEVSNYFRRLVMYYMFITVFSMLLSLAFYALYINIFKPTLPVRIITKTVLVEKKDVAETEQAKLEVMVTRYAKQYGVPVTLAKSLVYQESRWNPYAVSRVQASGLCQMMPSTFLIYADHEKRNIFNPEHNVEAAMKMLSTYRKKNMRWHEILARYNGGDGYWKSKEAQNYANEILARCEYK